MWLYVDMYSERLCGVNSEYSYRRAYFDERSYRDLLSVLLVRGCKPARKHGDQFIVFVAMMLVLGDITQKQDLLSSLLLRGRKPARTQI